MEVSFMRKIHKLLLVVLFTSMFSSCVKDFYSPQEQLIEYMDNVTNFCVMKSTGVLELCLKLDEYILLTDKEKQNKEYRNIHRNVIFEDDMCIWKGKGKFRTFDKSIKEDGVGWWYTDEYDRYTVAVINSGGKWIVKALDKCYAFNDVLHFETQIKPATGKFAAKYNWIVRSKANTIGHNDWEGSRYETEDMLVNYDEQLHGKSKIIAFRGTEILDEIIRVY